jgi:hypothetical protein
MGKREEDSRGREWEATPLSIESPLPAETPQLQAYRLAREHYGERGASLVARSVFERGVDETLELLRENIEFGTDVDELASSLWVPNW